MARLSIQRLMPPKTICELNIAYRIILGLLRKEIQVNVILNVLEAYETYIYLVNVFIKRVGLA